jgi:hypothetical protein
MQKLKGLNHYSNLRNYEVYFLVIFIYLPIFFQVKQYHIFLHKKKKLGLDKEWNK